MVQATKAGRWGKVKALQRLLTHSYSGKVLAVGRVTGNAGKKTAGVDGVIWGTCPEPSGFTSQIFEVVFAFAALLPSKARDD